MDSSAGAHCSKTTTSSTSSSSSSSDLTNQQSNVNFAAPNNNCLPLQTNMDNLLSAETGNYLIKHSDLVQVANCLQQLETAMFATQPPGVFHLAVDSTVQCYNPSDQAGWVDYMLTELNRNSDLLPPHGEFLIGDHQFPSYTSASNELLSGAGGFELLNDQTVGADHIRQVSAVTPDEESFLVRESDQNCWMWHDDQALAEEDSGVRLVHMLMTCAESIHKANIELAASLIQEMRVLLNRIPMTGIGKVAGCFVDALSRRVASGPSRATVVESPLEKEIPYRNFYEACPYLKFAHFTANQAILEAFHGHDQVHVIDFNLMHGLQWPALIQALALRPGGPPQLRLTGIGPPSPDGRDTLREIGLKIAELARSVNVRFSFRGVAADQLDEVKPWMLQINPKEAVAVNSILQLHRLLALEASHEPQPIEDVLKWLIGLKPKIMTVIEQEAHHNQANFLDRFTEALYFYSTMFDSLESCKSMHEKPLAELYLQREIHNILCCEGVARVERHEPLARWKARLVEAGFKPRHLGSNAFKQASMLLTLFSAKGYCVEENDGCLMLGWHDRPVVAASAWQAADLDGSFGSN